MCGISGIVYPYQKTDSFDWTSLLESCHKITKLDPDTVTSTELEQRLKELQQATQNLRDFSSIESLYYKPELQEQLQRLSQQLVSWEQSSRDTIIAQQPSAQTFEEWNTCWTELSDLAWLIGKDLLLPLERVHRITAQTTISPKTVFEAWQITTVLENIGRMEVRGRDSLGISIHIQTPTQESKALLEKLTPQAQQELQERLDDFTFSNLGVQQSRNDGHDNFVFAYKVAEEVGALGDNVHALYESIIKDDILWKLLSHSTSVVSAFSHTRWASNGIINEPNTHPVNHCALDSNGDVIARDFTLACCLNGDVDNYLQLVPDLAAERGEYIPKSISTDAKIIPLTINKNIPKEPSVLKAVARSLREFEGSVAIIAHSSLEPTKTYLALRGSGQSLFVGFMNEGYIFASELYGVVEQTSQFFRLDGNYNLDSSNPNEAGQIVVLDHAHVGTEQGFQVFDFMGNPVAVSDQDIHTADISTRDIDLQDHSHFLAKEIAEAPQSIRKTLLGKFTLIRNPENQSLEGVQTHLAESVIPTEAIEKLNNGTIKRILWIGQGTAAVAGQASAAYMQRVFPSSISVQSLKATELSGYKLEDSFDDTLVFAISQSGTTTDTNRTVDLIRERGATVVAIVNRRNSDLVYKVDGVLYTSDGRDIEMSVASTKAFYGQVIAGYLVTHHLSLKLNLRPNLEIAQDIEELERLPYLIQVVLKRQEVIKDLAQKFAPTRRDWAIVGSGLNRSAADEIRIKLSELCYKSIASDYIEDKKHIDLSSEPLTLVCAAGLGTVALKDAVKEIAIFKSHKSIPIVISSDDFDAFEAYSAGVIYVPKASEAASVLLNTVAGHLWGYYCALAIDAGATPLKNARALAVKLLAKHNAGSPSFPFRSIMKLARQVQQNLFTGRYNSSLEVQTAAELMSIINYLNGARSLRQFALEFNSGSSLQLDIPTTLLRILSESIHELSRPIDTIKHQAKTITVGISRLEDNYTGLIFDGLQSLKVDPGDIPYRDSNLIQTLNPVLEAVVGSTLYQVTGLNTMGEPCDSSAIQVVKKAGEASQVISRAEQSVPLRGTKEWVVRHNRSYIGIGKKDGRHIVIVPVVPKGYSEHIALFHVNFNESLSREDKAKFLRSFNQKYEDIKSHVTETDIPWSDSLLDSISVSDCVMKSTQEIASDLIKQANTTV